MGSTDQGRFISSGISIPQWMKNKSTEKTGFDPSALSPPAHDDDFLLIRFPRGNQQPEPPQPSCNDLLDSKEHAFLKHTVPCKQFIPILQDTVPVVKPKIIKPMGVDDGFKGEAAACATSVVAVAQQMVTGSFTTDDQRLVPPPRYLRHRRNSKSLPASPLSSPSTSPRPHRKNNTLFGLQNRFFTSPFVAEGEEQPERKTSSNWLLSGLLPALHRESALSSENLEQAASEHDIPEVKVTVKVAPEKEKPTLLKPKPSELREMNFWSPTSM